MPNNTYNPGSLSKISLIITNFDGSKQIDISSIFVNLSITEDIFKNTLYGSVIIKDAIGLLEGAPNNPNLQGFPIVGEEFLLVSYTPLNQDTVNLRFMVYSVDDIVYGKSNFKKQYTLNFCSEEHLIDSTTVVMKSYTGINSDNVQNLCKDFLQIDKVDIPYKGHAIKKFDKIQPTRGNQNVVIPRLPPIQAAHFLARRSIAADAAMNTGTYLFFENFKGFNFCDLEYLITQGITKFNSFGKYTSQTDYHPMVYRFEDPIVVGSTSKQPQLREMNAIQAMHQKHYFDTIEKLKRGLIESDTVLFDYTKGTYSPTRYRYITTLDKTNTNQVGLGNETGNSFPTNSNSFMTFATSNSDNVVKYSKFFMIPKDTSQPDTFLDTIYPNRASYFTGMAQNMFTLDTYGNTKVNAGDVIYATIPSSVDNSPNKFISGYYLVCTIRHIISQTYYHMKMDIYKNAVDTKLPTMDLPKSNTTSNTGNSK